MVAGLLSGNVNIVRVPTKKFEQTIIIASALKKLFKKNIKYENNVVFMCYVVYYNSILNLQNMFFRYKIKHLFINAVTIPCLDFEKFNCYKVHVNQDRFIGFSNSDDAYTNYARLSNQKISPHSIDSGFNSHYDEDTMKWYGNHLFDIIKDRDLL